jgi:hypothetical protein
MPTPSSHAKIKLYKWYTVHSGVTPQFGFLPESPRMNNATSDGQTEKQPRAESKAPAEFVFPQLPSVQHRPFALPPTAREPAVLGVFAPLRFCPFPICPPPLPAQEVGPGLAQPQITSEIQSESRNTAPIFAPLSWRFTFVLSRTAGRELKRGVSRKVATVFIEMVSN